MRKCRTRLEQLENIMRVIKSIVGSRNDRLLRKYNKSVQTINKLEPEYEAMTDEALRAKTGEFRERLRQGETLVSCLPEAFACVREAAKRTLGMRHFDVQLIGGMVLNDGKIAEMRTGEGKTLVATMPAYLNALSGQGVHVVTVNDYLAERDANWMRPVYDFLGVSVGVILTNMEPEQRKRVYECDIVYGTNNEFGFDYLRDNMVYDVQYCVQRPLNFAIIDEVDSILIDEARTPLIISGAAEESSDLYGKINALIPKLKKQDIIEEHNPLEAPQEIPEDQKGDYTVDEKNKQAVLTEQGHQLIESLLVNAGVIAEGDSLYDVKNISIMHYVNAALRANTLFKRDIDYVVKEGEIVIVDEHTGRLMDGRRWSEGLHQAVEAKEGVAIQLENQTLASITLQNYFRLYKKLSGMTGTADTEAYELQSIYGLEVVVIPTNKPMQRQDRDDMLFIDAKSKYDAVVEEIKECKKRQQPVLVGTASVESSEYLHRLLKQANVDCEVLNAKQHEREANIIAQAGRPGMVTISTSMAGRGTDIVLGGNLEAELAEAGDIGEGERLRIEQAWKERQKRVLDAGGLHVLCTERQESRRVDNQLRGRCGRQGDPGSTQFYLSMEDDLLRIFAGEGMMNLLRKLGVKEGDVIQAKMMNRSIETAQRRVESYNFDLRKQLLDYDDVANDQRKVIYQQRRQLLEAAEIRRSVEELRVEAVEQAVYGFMPPESLEEQWDIPGLENQLKQDFNMTFPIQSWLNSNNDFHAEQVINRVVQEIAEAYSHKMSLVDQEQVEQMEKGLMLQILDQHWKDHLSAMDHLRRSIHLRGYAQKNPKQEFKRESFVMFEELMDSIKYDLITTLTKIEVTDESSELPQQQPVEFHYQHQELDGLGREDVEADTQPNGGDQTPYRRTQPKVGRNDPCTCGSGKKYKQCCGRLK